jgi:hypothetical protein
MALVLGMREGVCVAAIEFLIDEIGSVPEGTKSISNAILYRSLSDISSGSL